MADSLQNSNHHRRGLKVQRICPTSRQFLDLHFHQHTLYTLAEVMNFGALSRSRCGQSAGRVIKYTKHVLVALKLVAS